MDVKIGMVNAPRELVADVDTTPDQFEKLLADAAPGSFVTLTDTRGRRMLIAPDKVAYVEFGMTTHGTVGFRS